MKSILAIIKLSELPEFWYKNFPFDALSVKPTVAAKARLMLPVGKELHIWEWFPCKTPTEGRAWGQKMAEACARHGATRFYINAEAEWSGVEKFERTNDPYNTLLAAMEGFYLFAPDGCQLFYNGFSWGRTSDGRLLHDADLMRAFHGWSPMCYGTSAVTVTGHILNKTNKYVKGAPATIRCPMVGVGRVDDKGQRWGHWTSTLAALKQVRADEVAFFFGNGAKSRYFTDEDHHPALVNCVKDLTDV